MQKWEYLTLTVRTGYAVTYEDDYLNIGVVERYNNRELPNWQERKWNITTALETLGDEGWELINVTWLDSSSSGRIIATVYYFKRPKA